MVLTDTWELQIRREAHPVDHDHPAAHVGTQDLGLAAPDTNGHVLAPAALSAQRTLGKGTNTIKVEIKPERSVRALVQALHQARRTRIRREGAVKRKTNIAVVRRRGKGREREKKRK